MEKLYLIRVGMERFLGPFTYKQVQEAYRKMQFGLQDEICGSLRVWVSFDNVEAVRRHYPELVQFIEGDMLSGWGGLASQQSHLTATQLKISLPEKNHSNNIGLILGIFVAFLFAALAFFSYQDGEFINPLAMLKDRTFYQAKILYGDKYNARFEGYMDRSRADINQTMKKKKGVAQWMPYVRSVAFAKDGRWEGINAKRLRGSLDSFLPQDCSEKAWEDRWRNSRDSWSAFLEGRELPGQDWARILVMDTHWVRNRSPMNGWIEPGSYHEACLRMAMRSLSKLASGDQNADSKVFLSRLRWQLGAVTRSSPSEEYEMSGTMWAVSCLEDIRDPADIKNCFNSIKVRRPWQSFFDASVTLRRMTLLVDGKTQLADAEIRSLSELMGAFQADRDALPLEYEEELRFYQDIIKQRGNIREARSNMSKKYPNIQFEP